MWYEYCNAVECVQCKGSSPVHSYRRIVCPTSCIRMVPKGAVVTVSTVCESHYSLEEQNRRVADAAHAQYTGIRQSLFFETSRVSPHRHSGSCWMWRWMGKCFSLGESVIMFTLWLTVHSINLLTNTVLIGHRKRVLLSGSLFPPPKKHHKRKWSS